MIKFAALAAISAATVGVTLPAQAGHIGGYEALHVSESNSRYSPDVLTVLVPAGVEKITVVCGQALMTVLTIGTPMVLTLEQWLTKVSQAMVFLM